MSQSHSPSYCPRRLIHPSPASPFATDNDLSWQGELSWQFEPSGWQNNRNLGSLLSPWVATSSTDRHQLVQRSANDYFLSHGNGGFQSFTNPYYENSRRIELQSFVDADHGNSFLGRHPHYTSGEDSKSHRFQNLGIIKKSRPGNSPLADVDELSLIKYTSPVEHEHQVSQFETDLHHRQHDYPRWSAVSRAYMDVEDNSMNVSHHNHHHHQHDVHLHTKPSLSPGFEKHGHQGHGHDHGVLKSTSHHYDMNEEYNDIDQNSAYDEDNEDEDDGKAPRSVGLFSLFRYSTKLDMLLVFFGCLGALINGGSLPLYSLLFGNFANKIGKSDANDKTEMLKDVQQVRVPLFFINYEFPSVIVIFKVHIYYV